MNTPPQVPEPLQAPIEAVPPPPGWQWPLSTAALIAAGGLLALAGTTLGLWAINPPAARAVGALLPIGAVALGLGQLAVLPLLTTIPRLYPPGSSRPPALTGARRQFLAPGARGWFGAAAAAIGLAWVVLLAEVAGWHGARDLPSPLGACGGACAGIALIRQYRWLATHRRVEPPPPAEG
jgi:hypothetical protein